MPYSDEQRKAIAADMSRKGKSDEVISQFFRKHGHGGKKTHKKPSHARRGR